MRHYILTLSYRGAGLGGWQVQNNATTVQGELDRALGILFGVSVHTTGAGRTDAGVNAVNYVCDFETPEPLHLTKGDFIYKINAILRQEIVVHDIAEDIAGTGGKPWRYTFNSRFSAKSRTYRYFVHGAKDPFAEGFSWRCPRTLDMDRMNEAAKLLLGEHDFSCFEKVGGGNATSVCTVLRAEWSRYTPAHVTQLGFPDDGNYLVFTIEANRFLRNMVRAIVGTLIDVGRGRRSPESITELLAGGKRSDAGESVPGTALFLYKINY